MATKALKVHTLFGKVINEFPLSHGQKALWILQQMDPQNAAYNIIRAVEIKTDFDVDAYEQTWRILIDRHDLLRTTFTVKNGEPFQQVHESLDFKLNRIDASNWDDNQLDSRMCEDSMSPFDLMSEPLVRISVYVRSPIYYVVLYNFHHIISDLWSMAIMMIEKGKIYDAIKSSSIFQLSPLKLYYQSYVKESKEILSGERGKDLWRYWSNQFKIKPPILNLPTNRIRPAVQNVIGSAESIRLGSVLTKELKSFSIDHNSSFYTLMIAAYYLLLFKYTNQTEIVVGLPKLGRSRKYMRLVGYFVNTIPLFIQISPSGNFLDLLKKVHQKIQETNDYEDYPFSLLVEKLKIARDPSRSSLFQTMFTFQKTTRQLESDGLAFLAIGESGGQMNWGSIPLTTRALSKRVTPFDITVLVAETGDDLLVSFQYNDDLFEQQIIKNMLNHYKNLLESITAAPYKSLLDIPVLSKDEYQHIIYDWNRTEQNNLENLCVHRLFEQKVQESPDSIAILFEHQKLTFAQLNQRANQLARYLIKLGIGLENAVGVCLTRSHFVATCFIGILKANCVYLPLDSTFPSDRLEFMIFNAGIKILLTEKKIISKFKHISIPTIALDEDLDTINKEESENLDCSTSPDNLAYIIYTSGTTGQPKGTMLPHRGVCNVALVQQQFFSLKKNDRVLQFASLSFDASIWDMIMTLLSGATLVFASKDRLYSPKALTNLLNEYNVSLVTLPPSVLSFLQEPELPNLSTIITAGEACKKDLVDQWINTHHFFNAYGPTEASICVSIKDVTGNNYKVPPIGKPIANTELYILNEQMIPVPVGVPGELHISGIGLARGYVNRPDLTAEKFICNPFSKQPGARLYKTGDLVRYLPDGNIEFLGRIDHQVKIRGFRIECEEIEAILSEHEQVNQAIVDIKKYGPNDVRLVAYVEHGKQEKPEVTDLRNHLRRYVPDFMIPSSFIILQTFPLTNSGKVDRNVLPNPSNQRSEDQTAFVDPQTPIEQKLVSLWKNELKIDKVSVHDNFFDFGGHSLLIIKLHQQIQREFKTDISVTELFQYPTVHSLAKYLNKDETENSFVISASKRAKKQKISLNTQKERLRTRSRNLCMK